MNNVVLVMANSRLQKWKDVRKTKDYNDDFASDDEWNGEENEANSSLYPSDKDILGLEKMKVLVEAVLLHL